MDSIALQNLNNVQTQIVSHIKGPVMVLAGAGSGKTRVLTNRILYILEHDNVTMANILAITFTNKAANEMKERLAQMGANLAFSWVATFHSMCCKILREQSGKLEGFDKNFSIFDDADKRQTIKRILKNLELEDDYLNEVSKHLSNCKNKNLTLDEYLTIYSNVDEIETIIKVCKLYEQELKQNNAMDFDDIIKNTLILFKTNTDVLEHYQEKFKYILVDEFQDTNATQYDLIKLLGAKHKNVFAVGDEDQSIYSWRGANINNIKSFLTDFENATLYKLEQNYRSTKNIINCANTIIKHNANRIDKTLFTENNEGVRVEFRKCFNETEEAEIVSEQIKNLVQYSGYKYSDIAVLMRLNALTRNFEERFLSYNIPYKVFGGMKFYERAEIKTLLAYLKVLVNPYDNESFRRIINTPKRGIGEVAIKSLEQFGSSLFNNLIKLNEDSNLSKNVLSKLLPVKNLFLLFLEMANKLSLSELVTLVIKETNFLAQFDHDDEDGKNRILNVNDFVFSVKQFEEANPDCSLSDYLQQVSLITDIDTYSSSDNNVVLSTVHAVKGLEFKVVFIIGLEEKYFPIQRFDSTDEDLEEERRLMYVAVTRARERLFLTCAQRRYMYGRSDYTVASRFLKEAGVINPPISTRPTTTQNPFMKSGSLKNMFGLSSAKSIEFHVHDLVLHTNFGVGTVVRIEDDGKTAVINFKTIGNKTLSLDFAPLKLIRSANNE